MLTTDGIWTNGIAGLLTEMAADTRLRERDRGRASRIKAAAEARGKTKVSEDTELNELWAEVYTKVITRNSAIRP